MFARPSELEPFDIRHAVVADERTQLALAQLAVTVEERGVESAERSEKLGVDVGGFVRDVLEIVGGHI
ncbi:MAG: hypothetical protein Q7S96_04255 [bacterium]|nr:hypothetical protein [bacterium]